MWLRLLVFILLLLAVLHLSNGFRFRSLSSTRSGVREHRATDTRRRTTSGYDSRRIQHTTPKIRTSSGSRRIRSTTERIRTTNASRRIRSTTERIRTTIGRIRTTTERIRRTTIDGIRATTNRIRITWPRPRSTTTSRPVRTTRTTLEKSPAKRQWRRRRTTTTTTTKRPTTTTTRPSKYIPPPDASFHSVNLGPNYYQPHPQLQPLSYGQTQNVITNSPVFVSPGRFHFRPDHTLLGMFIGYNMHTLVSGHVDSNHDPERYVVIHHHHHYDRAIPKEIRIDENTLGQCGNLVGYCAPGTSALCLMNGTVFCIAPTTKTQPCKTDSSNMTCVEAKIPTNYNLTDIQIPCISRIEFPPDFAERISINTSNSKSFISIKPPDAINSSSNGSNEIENLRRSFGEILMNIMESNSSLDQALLANITLLAGTNSTRRNETYRHPNCAIITKTTSNITTNSSRNEIEVLRQSYREILMSIVRIVGSNSTLGQQLLANITSLTHGSSITPLGNGTVSNATLDIDQVWNPNITYNTPCMDSSPSNVSHVNESSTISGKNKAGPNGTFIIDQVWDPNITYNIPLLESSRSNVTYLNGSSTIVTNGINQAVNSSSLQNSTFIIPEATSKRPDVEGTYCVILIAEPQPRRRKMTNDEFLKFADKNKDLSNFVSAKGEGVLQKFLMSIYF